MTTMPPIDAVTVNAHSNADKNKPHIRVRKQERHTVLFCIQGEHVGGR